MILWNIKQLEEKGAEDIYVVLGFRGDEIKSELVGNKEIKSKINYIEQEDGSRGGMIKSIIVAGMAMKNEPFFLVMSDLIVENNPYDYFKSIEGLNDNQSIFMLIGTDKNHYKRSGANSKVFVKDGNVRFVSPNLSDYNGLDVGIYYFSPKSFFEVDRIYKEGITSFNEILQKMADKNLGGLNPFCFAIS